MEYIDGEDLAKMVKSRGPLPVVHACYFIYQAALGLQHAHERGMVHRDIKPANLIFATEGKKGVVKVLDFGLAKVTSEGQTDSGLTREGQMLGTPDYIAPEQIRDAQSADIRADIYSLGCTFYHLLTGGPPFRGDHLWDLYQAHFSMEAGPLNLVRPEVPVELAAVVAKMMAKQAGRRFQTPGEVARALTPFFKKGSVAVKEANPEKYQAGQPDAKEATPDALSMPPRPAMERPPASVSEVRKPSPTEPGWILEGLIDLGETQPRSERVLDHPPPVAARAASRRILQFWSTTVEKVSGLGPRARWSTAGVLLLGFVVAGVVVFRTRELLKDDGTESSRTAKKKARQDASPAVETASAPASINNSIGMTLNLIPAGEFVMGSPDDAIEARKDEKPSHRVRISKPFYLGVCEVTQAQYEAVMGNNPSCFAANGKFKDRVAGQSTDWYPVENVSWLDAIQFCNKLSEKERRKPFYEIEGNYISVPDWSGPGYRLPTEAEWEYACRANASTPTRFSFGDNAVELGGYGWFDGTSERRTHPVGQKWPNGFGLHDTHGNVWEWCWDWYGEGYYNQSATADPTGPGGTQDRVLRGGGWYGGPGSVRSASRGHRVPEWRIDSLGVRLALAQSGR